ncbi:hypothetical protein Lal_00010924 [Lupinus albus]|uniref:Putative transcription factor bHLH family n=1 Tax=Lupinus albus TaxID=3870 RepID=A0A6A4PTU2_LUPAL|nr:putative transcription factor bHLH family [Lupinus albus]KAF1892459.1 hypothetical protein Lal_00010924 [Lupinus albus]
MENIGEEYKHYWETNMFLQTQELDSWGLDEALFVYYDSSSPDGPTSAATSKNIVSERNRRKKLNERLFALRSVVPNISKMDKASIIKDAIEYIQHLHEEEKNIKAEIMELESEVLIMNPNYDFQQDLPLLLSSKKKKIEQQLYDSVTPTNYPIQILELRVTYMGEKSIVVNMRCNKRRDTMVKLCEVFESLKLKVITANVTSFSDTLFKTIFIEAEEEEKDLLQIKIQTAIAALNDPLSSMSI